MAQFQQVYTTYPSPAVVVNTPTPMGYTYAQHPAMQSYYPSMQPGSTMIQQPNGYYQGGPAYVRRHHPCTECCLSLLCLSACTCCCAEECCCGGDECCYGSGYYNDDSCYGCC